MKTSQGNTSSQTNVIIQYYLTQDHMTPLAVAESKGHQEVANIFQRKPGTVQRNRKQTLYYTGSYIHTLIGERDRAKALVSNCKHFSVCMS